MKILSLALPWVILLTAIVTQAQQPAKSLQSVMDGECQGRTAELEKKYIHEGSLASQLDVPGARTWQFDQLKKDAYDLSNTEDPQQQRNLDCLNTLLTAGMLEEKAYWDHERDTLQCDNPTSDGGRHASLDLTSELATGVEVASEEPTVSADRLPASGPDQNENNGSTLPQSQQLTTAGAQQTNEDASDKSDEADREAHCDELASSQNYLAGLQVRDRVNVNAQVQAAQKEEQTQCIDGQCKTSPDAVTKSHDQAKEVRTAACCEVFRDRDKDVFTSTLKKWTHDELTDAKCDYLANNNDDPGSVKECLEGFGEGLIAGIKSQISWIGDLYTGALWSGLATLWHNLKTEPMKAMMSMWNGFLESCGIDDKYVECLAPNRRGQYYCSVVSNVVTQIVAAEGWGKLFNLLFKPAALNIADKLKIKQMFTKGKNFAGETVGKVAKVTWNKSAAGLRRAVDRMTSLKIPIPIVKTFKRVGNAAKAAYELRKAPGRWARAAVNKVDKLTDLAAAKRNLTKLEGQLKYFERTEGPKFKGRDARLKEIEAYKKEISIKNDPASTTEAKLKAERSTDRLTLKRKKGETKLASTKSQLNDLKSDISALEKRIAATTKKLAEQKAAALAAAKKTALASTGSGANNAAKNVTQDTRPVLSDRQARIAQDDLKDLNDKAKIAKKNVDDLKKTYDSAKQQAANSGNAQWTDAKAEKGIEKAEANLKAVKDKIKGKNADLKQYKTANFVRDTKQDFLDTEAKWADLNNKLTAQKKKFIEDGTWPQADVHRNAIKALEDQLGQTRLEVGRAKKTGVSDVSALEAKATKIQGELKNLRETYQAEGESHATGAQWRGKKALENKLKKADDQLTKMKKELKNVGEELPEPVGEGPSKVTRVTRDDVAAAERKLKSLEKDKNTIQNAYNEMQDDFEKNGKWPDRAALQKKIQSAEAKLKVAEDKFENGRLRQLAPPQLDPLQASLDKAKLAVDQAKANFQAKQAQHAGTNWKGRDKLQKSINEVEDKLAKVQEDLDIKKANYDAQSKLGKALRVPLERKALIVIPAINAVDRKPTPLPTP